MKYYVQVNRHMMATVEAETALRAEHFFLDLDGIQYSHAFDNEARSTDTFRGALLDCDTFSKEQIQALSEEYAKAWHDVALAEAEVNKAKDEVKRLEELLHKAKEWLDVTEQAHRMSLTEAQASKRKLYLED